MAVTARRVRLSLLVALTTIVTIVISLLPSAAFADPDEGGSAALSTKLEEAAIAYYEIQG
jgi:hypothetical protein